MALLAQAASRGVDWEALLVEMLRLLHRIAMVQLLPASLTTMKKAMRCACGNWRASCRLPICSFIIKPC